MSRNTIGALLLLCAAACGDQPKRPAPAPGNPLSAARDLRPIEYLAGAYATAERPDAPVAQLFDEDPATYWETPAGCAPDEAIVLLFEQPLRLKSLALGAAAGTFAAGARLQVYRNGVALPVADPNQIIPLEGQPVRELVLRFVATGLEEITDVTHEGAHSMVRRYPATASLRVHSLQLHDATDALLRLQAPARLPGKIVASTTLGPVAAFAADWLFDARPAYAWAEGNLRTTGEGEQLQFVLPDSVHITALQIWNGYQRSEAHFSANTRLRSFEFGAEGGLRHGYTLRDTKGPQRIVLTTPASGRTLDLKIQSAYPGKQYKDLVISELLFFNEEKPFVLSTGFQEKTRSELRAQAAGTPLAEWLDRGIHNTVDGAIPVEKSLLLRSDGTFCYYRREENAPEEQAAEGNWLLEKSDARQATLRLFGGSVLRQVMSAAAEGTANPAQEEIFGDRLVLRPYTAQGGELIGLMQR